MSVAVREKKLKLVVRRNGYLTDGKRLVEVRSVLRNGSARAADCVSGDPLVIAPEEFELWRAVEPVETFEAEATR